MKRDSDKREHQGTLRFEYELDAPPAKVWRALTVPEFVARWLTARIIDPEAKGPESASAGPSPSLSLRLLDSEPCQSVRYVWGEEGSPFPESVVTFRLRSNDSGGTTFGIVHELTRAAGALAGREPANSNTPRLLLAA